MRKSLVILFICIFNSSPLFATVDGMTTIFFVTSLYEEDYTVRPSTTVACYGLEYGPQTMAFTEKFLVTSNMGCGGPPLLTNINALSCAVSNYTWDEKYEKVIKAEIGIGLCLVESQNLDIFREAIIKAAKENFGPWVDVEITQAIAF